METAISTTRLLSLSGSLRSLAGIFIIPPVVYSFYHAMPCPPHPTPTHAISFTREDRQAHESIPRLPSSTVCNLLDSPVLGSMHIQSKKNTKQTTTGSAFLFFSWFLPGKVSYLLFFFTLSDVPVGVVVHSRHISWLDYAVLFWEIGFGKGLV